MLSAECANLTNSKCDHSGPRVLLKKLGLCLGMDNEMRLCRPKADTLCVGKPGLRDRFRAAIRETIP